MRYFFLISLSAGILFLSSCDKAEILEKRLEGRWQVSVYQKTVTQGNSIIFSESLNYAAVGNITFNTDGKGNYAFVYDLGESTFGLSGIFEWDNTDEAVSIRENGLTRVFRVTKNSKSEMVFERTVKPYYFQDADPGLTYTMEERLVLKK